MYTSQENKLGRRPAGAGKFQLLGMIVLACILAGCAVGPDFVRPAAPTTQRYDSGEQPGSTIATVGGAQHFEYRAEVASDWWKLFGCPKLDGMVLQATANNPTLQSAQAALKQSEDLSLIHISEPTRP